MSYALSATVHTFVRADAAHQGTVIIDAMDPQVMVQVSDELELHDVADDAAQKMKAAIESLSESDAAQ
jgi:homoserine acetyltransferase